MSTTNKKVYIDVKVNPITEEEKVLFKKYFAEVFLFGKPSGDVYSEFAKKINSTRQRAKEIFWVGIHHSRSGYFFNEYHRTREQLFTLARLLKENLAKQGVDLSIHEIIGNVEEMVYEKQQRLQQEKKNKGVS